MISPRYLLTTTLNVISFCKFTLQFAISIKRHDMHRCTLSSQGAAFVKQHTSAILHFLNEEGAFFFYTSQVAPGRVRSVATVGNWRRKDAQIDRNADRSPLSSTWSRSNASALLSAATRRMWTQAHSCRLASSDGSQE